MIDLTKRQKLFYQLQVIAPKNFFFKNQEFSLPQLATQLEGSKVSGYTRDFITELIENKIIIYSSDKLIESRWNKMYKIDLERLNDYISKSEWFKDTKMIIDNAILESNPVSITKRQNMFYHIYMIAPKGFFSRNQDFTLQELEEELGISEDTRCFIEELKENKIINFSQDKMFGGVLNKFYKINLKLLENYISKSEWYQKSLELVQQIYYGGNF